MEFDKLDIELERAEGTLERIKPWCDIIQHKDYMYICTPNDYVTGGDADALEVWMSEQGFQQVNAFFTMLKKGSGLVEIEGWKSAVPTGNELQIAYELHSKYKLAHVQSRLCLYLELIWSKRTSPIYCSSLKNLADTVKTSTSEMTRAIHSLHGKIYNCNQNKHSFTFESIDWHLIRESIAGRVH